MQEIRRRLLVATITLFLVFGGGSLGFYLIGDGQWEYFDCLYMAAITVTTVGFTEVLPGLGDVEHARLFTMILIIMGMGSFLYVASTLAAMIIEGDLQEAFKETRMQKSIAKLKDHIIVCGLGSTGRHVFDELQDYDIQTVVIDHDPDIMAAFSESHPKVGHIVGDATDDDVLEKANIKSAMGIVAALADDKSNLYLTISAREANPGARIVARGSDLRVLEKLRKAGADTVVSPNYIGGIRMVSELLRPKVVRFLDEMRRDRSRTRIEELDIAEKSSFVGKSLADISFRKSTDLLVLAVKEPNVEGYTFNPGADFVLAPNMTLVVLGPISQVKEIRQVASGDAEI